MTTHRTLTGIRRLGHTLRARVTTAFLSALVILLGAAQADAKKFLDAISAKERQVLTDLYDGRIIHAEPFGANQNTGSLYKVKVENQGRTYTAVLKPRTFGDRDGWARTPMEVAVYKLNRILGLDMVPPSAYRKNLNINGRHVAEGALILWVDGAHGIQDVPHQEWKPRREAFSSDLRILQSIGRDADNQNGHNILRGRHWKDGKWRLIKVDNEACMRPGAYVNLDHELPTWGKVKRFNYKTFERLKELNFHDLKGDVGEFLSDHEINEWLATRDRLVSHIHNELQRRDNVFFTREEIAFDTRLKVGKKASAHSLGKFKRMMEKKGVKAALVPASDKRLAGATAKTILTPAGIKVYMAKDGTRSALVEELVHVNQLLSMSKKVGGTDKLYAKLRAKDPRSFKTLKLSMEDYAKDRLGVTMKTPREKKSLSAARRRYRHQAARQGITSSTQVRTMWRAAATAR